MTLQASLWRTICLIGSMGMSAIPSLVADEPPEKQVSAQSSLEEFRSRVADRLVETGAFEEADQLITLRDLVNEYSTSNRCQPYSQLAKKVSETFLRAGFHEDFGRPVVRGDLNQCLGFIRENGNPTAAKKSNKETSTRQDLDAVRACMHVEPTLDECRTTYIVYAARYRKGADVADSRRDQLVEELAGLFGALR